MASLAFLAFLAFLPFLPFWSFWPFYLFGLFGLFGLFTFLPFWPFLQKLFILNDILTQAIFDRLQWPFGGYLGLLGVFWPLLDVRQNLSAAPWPVMALFIMKQLYSSKKFAGNCFYSRSLIGEAISYACKY